MDGEFVNLQDLRDEISNAGHWHEDNYHLANTTAAMIQAKAQVAIAQQLKRIADNLDLKNDVQQMTKDFEALYERGLD